MSTDHDVTAERSGTMSDLSTKEVYYENAQLYWEKAPATVDGVMGGYGKYSGLDIRGSEEFLKKVLSLLKQGTKKIQNSVSLDCGAGVGRISIDLLKKYYDNLHLVEVAEPLLNVAKQKLDSYPSSFFCTSLHQFQPPTQYNTIWCQWVLSHLTDEDLIAFLRLMGESITSTGFIVVKENITRIGTSIPDETDSSKTRSKNEFEDIFKASSLSIIAESKQNVWPPNLFPVHMWALRVDLLS